MCGVLHKEKLCYNTLFFQRLKYKKTNFSCQPLHKYGASPHKYGAQKPSKTTSEIACCGVPTQCGKLKLNYASTFYDLCLTYIHFVTRS